MLTTSEAAALLSERGMTDRAGGPVKADTVKHMCARGAFPGAVNERRGPGRGFWLIPLAEVESYAARYQSSSSAHSRSSAAT